MILQLWAAGGATVLAVRDRFDRIAFAYIAGAVSGLVVYVAVSGAAGELSLGWSMLAMAVVTCAAMLDGVRTSRAPAEATGPPRPASVLRRFARGTRLVLGSTAIYLAFNALYVITLAFASNYNPGDATVLSYAYLFASYLVAATGFALGMSRIADMRRGALADWREVIADTVPAGFRYSMLLVAPALAALVAGGATLIGEVLPKSFTPPSVAQLRTFAALLGAWTVAALLVNLLLPALFALGPLEAGQPAGAGHRRPPHRRHRARRRALRRRGRRRGLLRRPARLRRRPAACRRRPRRAGRSPTNSPATGCASRCLPAVSFGIGAAVGDDPCQRRRRAAAHPRNRLAASTPRVGLRLAARTGAAAARRACGPRRHERRGPHRDGAGQLGRAARSPEAAAYRRQRRCPRGRPACSLVFALLAALSWRAWGVPTVDAGHELNVASSLASGAQPYGDIRYFYGPAGVYALGGAFALFGAGFTTAFAFGLLQAAAILAAFYALSRQLLPALPSFIATAVVAAIGFSGTAFNFVLPHTNSGHLRPALPAADAAGALARAARAGRAGGRRRLPDPARVRRGRGARRRRLPGRRRPPARGSTRRCEPSCRWPCRRWSSPAAYWRCSPPKSAPPASSPRTSGRSTSSASPASTRRAAGRRWTSRASSRPSPGRRSTAACSPRVIAAAVLVSRQRGTAARLRGALADPGGDRRAGLPRPRLARARPLAPTRSPPSRRRRPTC